VVKTKSSIKAVQILCVMVGILGTVPLTAYAGCITDSEQCSTTVTTQEECESKSVSGTWNDGVCGGESTTTTPSTTDPGTTTTDNGKPTTTDPGTTTTDNGEPTTTDPGTTTTDNGKPTTTDPGTTTTDNGKPTTTDPGTTTTDNGKPTTTDPGTTTTDNGKPTTTDPGTTTTDNGKPTKEDNNLFSLPVLKVYGVDNTGKSVEGLNAIFAGGISVDRGKSFVDATQTPLELKKGGSIQVKGSITPADGHKGKLAELIVVGLHTSDTNDASCIFATGKHTYYMMVDATPTSEIYCEWKNGGECKDDNNLPRARSKDTATGYYTEWTGWDTTLVNLKPFRTITSLDKLEEIQLYVDNNVGYTGFVCVNFGYRLTETRTIIFNGDPLKFKVSE